MSKLTRVIQKVFGSTAGPTGIGVFGSLAAGSPATTADATTVQSLSNYLTGWLGAVLANNSPAIEDMNALHFLFSRQLAYLMQTGVPEWEAGTVYYIGSLVNDGLGNVYASTTDANAGNALTSAANWRLMLGNVFRAVSADTTATLLDRVIEVSAPTVDVAVTLPTAATSLGHSLTVIKTDSSTNIVTAGGKALLAQNDSVTLISNGSVWYSV